MMTLHFWILAIDASGKRLFEEQNGGELPRKMFDEWFDEIRTKAAESGATMIIINAFKHNRDKDTTTYTKQEFINGKWTKEKTITPEEYESYFDE